ncbi:MAG: ABC transporter ATP-binding protein [Elainellaceae cyanobacterium]
MDVSQYLSAQRTRDTHSRSVIDPAQIETPIVARDVRMRFQSGADPYWVLQGTDLTVHRGTFQFLIGPSGVGKTTLLSILAGILTPTAGEVLLLGQPITQLPKCDVAALRLAHVGFIFQDLNLLASLNVLENIELALHLKGIQGSDARRQARILLHQVNLEGKANQLPRSLSGGEKQRVAIARALAGYPAIIFADEPTSALDSGNGLAVVELLQSLTAQGDHTVLMATHDYRFTGFADRIWHLEDGLLREENS